MNPTESTAADFLTPPDLCGVCKKSRAHHMSDGVHHEFNTQGRLIPKRSNTPQRTSASAQGSAGSSLTVDPVLRLALIRNGAVTLAELEVIESELKASGVAYAGPIARAGGEDNPNWSGESTG